MHKHFRDYYWKKGKPYGIQVVNAKDQQVSYKIVTDPYFKRFSIEKYHFESFDKIIYDSLLLDFRRLTLKDQNAWEREIVQEDNDKQHCLLRNEEGRAVLIEILTFSNDKCIACETKSIHGITLSKHCMYNSKSFNGVILYDSNERPVMQKSYETDPETGEFTNLLEEKWDMSQNHYSRLSLD